MKKYSRSDIKDAIILINFMHDNVLNIENKFISHAVSSPIEYNLFSNVYLHITRISVFNAIEALTSTIQNQQ